MTSTATENTSADHSIQLTQASTSPESADQPIQLTQDSTSPESMELFEPPQDWGLNNFLLEIADSINEEEFKKMKFIFSGIFFIQT